MKKYKCYKCKKELSIDDFHKNKNKKNGIGNTCKKCKSIEGKEYRKTEEGIKKVKAQTEKRKHDPKYRFYKYMSGADDRNIKFNITFDDFMFFWEKECFYCGDIVDGIGLDRIDNKKGYTKRNIVSCCPLCNRMKMALDKNIFIDQCNKISKNYL